MLRYILFALLFIVVIINFLIKSIWEHLFKKDINEKEEIVVKLGCFAMALLLVLIIMFA